MKQTKKLKIVMPTLREKERYIAFEIISEEPIYYLDFESAVWQTLINFHGELGASKTSFWIVKNLFDERNQVGVIRCNNLSVPQIITTLGMISRIGDNRVTIKIHKVSGTIKGLGQR